jgi:hypothetical protein
LKLPVGAELGKKSMIIVVPSCLKDADGARTRSDQKNELPLHKMCLVCEVIKKNKEEVGAAPKINFLQLFATSKWVVDWVGCSLFANLKINNTHIVVTIVFSKLLKYIQIANRYYAMGF